MINVAILLKPFWTLSLSGFGFTMCAGDSLVVRCGILCPVRAQSAGGIWLVCSEVE